ncbi:MAG TPA: hypothetical protein VF516_46105, partial [Kofleriaceae bacterium]
AQPVLLVLEDLHWGDFGTVRFVDTALRDRRDRPWMVLALARPEVLEVFPRLWAERQNVQEIRLQELGRKAGERLVRQVLGDSVGPETLERLVRHAGGNAFYLEELIRAAAEGKDHALPDTVLAMVETRLARLSVEARRVLRAASVFGEVCWEGGVAALLDGAMTAAAVAEWLERLAEQEVLAVRPHSRVPGERELAFRHALLREGTYATLTEDDKRLGHRLAGTWLEHHGESDPMVLAGHFERGGNGERAAEFYLRAAEQAHPVLLDREATLARAALGLACAPTPPLRIALLGIRCEAAAAVLHLIRDVLADVEEVLRTAPRGTKPWAQAMLAYSETILFAGRTDDLRALVTLLRDLDPVPEAVTTTALVLLTTICMLDAFGFVADATALEERLAFIRSRAEREPMVQLWWHTAIGMRAGYAHDDPWRGLQDSDAIQAIHAEARSEVMVLNMQLFRALNLWYLGAFEAAEQLLRSIAAADEAIGPASSLRRLTLAWLLADRGALDPARAVA